MSVAQFQELRQAFRLFDKNNDGYIDAKELVHCTTTLGQKLSPEEVKAFLEEADLDGDGKLNYMEFAKMMTSDDWVGNENIKRLYYYPILIIIMLFPKTVSDCMLLTHEIST